MTDVASGSLRSLREGNRVRLISLLREHGSLHRAELARRAGLARATVSTIVVELLAEGIVVEEGGDGSGARGSSKRAGLTLNPGAGVVVGLDFSATSVTGVAADLSHEVVADGTRALPEALTWQGRLDTGVELIDDLLRRAGVGKERLVGVGLGVPGPVNWATGEIGVSSHSLLWAGAQAAERLNERLGVPVSQDNTAHLGVLAEAAWGAAQGCRNVIYVKASTGLSAGLVVDGRAFRGALGATGALGHMSVEGAGLACPCGSRGCLEMYSAVPAVLAALQPMYGVLTFDQVLDMISAGNRACVRALRDAATTLGRGLAGVCNLLNLDRVVIGGDLARAGELFLSPLRDGLEQHALPIVSEQLAVVRGELGERAGALGGVALMLRETQLTGGNA